MILKFLRYWRDLAISSWLFYSFGFIELLNTLALGFLIFGGRFGISVLEFQFFTSDYLFCIFISFAVELLFFYAVSLFCAKLKQIDRLKLEIMELELEIKAEISGS